MSAELAYIPHAAVLSVSEVNQQARVLLEEHFRLVLVQGEISNLKVVSGHTYFTLKDAQSQIACVLFRREAMQLRFQAGDGQHVIAKGKLTVYAPYGRYQLVLEHLEPMGAGALQLAFEQLKVRLATEGLFRRDRKKQLPLVPRRVAVVTSPTGAVIRDIVNIASRRFPAFDILVVPTRVQGVDSADDIARALEKISVYANEWRIDAVILARGGGSLEDLWGFNTEIVGRAIAKMPIPVVSAVGHETDVTIADFVADIRAPTPSAAAELTFPITRELRFTLTSQIELSAKHLQRHLTLLRHRLEKAHLRLGDGPRLIRDMVQKIHVLQLHMQQAVQKNMTYLRDRFITMTTKINRLHPNMRMRNSREQLLQLEHRLILWRTNYLANLRQRIVQSHTKLAALSPVAILERGYSIATNQQQLIVRAADQLNDNEVLRLRFAKGQAEVAVRKVIS